MDTITKQNLNDIEKLIDFKLLQLNKPEKEKAIYQKENRKEKDYLELLALKMESVLINKVTLSKKDMCVNIKHWLSYIKKEK